MNLLNGFLLLCSVANGLCASQSFHALSTPLPGRTATLGDSTAAELSADGKWTVFNSSGNGIATNDHNGLALDLFLRDNTTGDIQLITRGPDGSSGNDHSYEPMISSDGRLVVFSSDATNLIADDENETTDLFLYDRVTGEIDLLSQLDGEQADEPSDTPIMTPDGRFVLFRTDATNLSEDDHNEMGDLYLLDRQTGQLQLVTYDSDGTGSATGLAEVNVDSAGISDDGRYVAFRSFATNLVHASFPGNSAFRYQVYLRDMQTGENRLLSATEDGAAATSDSWGSGDSWSPVLSADGRYVAFITSATDIAGSVNIRGGSAVFLYDVVNATTRQLPYPTEETAAYGLLEFSADGRYLVYEFGNTIYRWDTAAASNKLVSAAPDGTPVAGSEPAISADGTVITFVSDAPELPGSHSSSVVQLYAAYPDTGTIRSLSQNALGEPADTDIIHPVIAADGKTAAFATRARNLVADDEKNAYDVFLASVESPQTGVILVSSGSPLVTRSTANGPSNFHSFGLSADGRYVVFSSNANDLAPGDDNVHEDVFLRDLQTGTTTLLSQSADGSGAGNAPSTAPAISPNGRSAVYLTTATNIVPNPEPYAVAIVHYDLQAGTNRLLATSTSGPAPDTQHRIKFSPEGDYVVHVNHDKSVLQHLETGNILFQTNSPFLRNYFLSSNAEKLLFGYSVDTYLHDLKNGTTTRLRPTGEVHALGLSDDGSIALSRMYTFPREYHLVLHSLADNSTNLISRTALDASLSGDGKALMYVEQLDSGEQKLIHLDLQTGETNTIVLPDGRTDFRAQNGIVLTANGNVAAFVVKPDLVAGGMFNRLFIYDHSQRRTVEIGTGADDGGHNTPALSADGDIVVFKSSSSSLVANDLNSANDVFLFHRLTLGANVHNGELTLSWRALPTERYQIQSCASLTEGDWKNVGTPMEGAGIITQHLPAADTAALYRIQLVE